MRKKILAALLAVALCVGFVALPAIAEAPIEQEGWIKNPANGHYYKLTTPMPWLEAEAQAVEWGGHLVTINDREEEVWLRSQFGADEVFWIGFNDIAVEGNWEWASGEPVTYTNWDECEPNNGTWEGHEGNEDAAMMNDTPWSGTGDGWNDLPIEESAQRGIVETVAEPVEIDIKPGSYPNSINLKSKGLVPVAVLTTDFDASTIDPETVLFAGASPVRSTLEDVNGDGELDMLFHFKTQDLSLTKDSTEATLTGSTDIGQPIQGTDTVNIVPKGK